jgi:hypothetical protein
MDRLLTIACGDYDRTHALVDGSVKPEGLTLNWLDLPHLEIWTRMLNYYDFDYFRDVCSLTLEASCQTSTRIYKGQNCRNRSGVEYRSLFYLFARGARPIRCTGQLMIPKMSQAMLRHFGTRYRV